MHSTVLPRVRVKQPMPASATFLAKRLTPHPSARSQSSLNKPGGKPVNFGVLLFPAFQALDVFGPLDALNVLSRSYPMNLYTIAATMDPVSTKLLTEQPIKSSFEQLIQPTHTLETAPPLDVLLVPGGQGTRTQDMSHIVDYIKKTFPSLQYLITVCTGSGLAARAGVLGGKRATTNKLVWDATVALGPEVEWVRQARWVQDGNIWTSSGISAGIDVTFAWIEAVYGAEDAQTIADRMEYTRVTSPDDDPFSDLFQSHS
jgi:transcriptional regulator GlxA family with amidase domain